MSTMNATYSAEDNRLRLYSVARLSPETYARVKAAGFQWAPKQELFVAPAWTPAREDLLLELCGEIGDEDYSATERAADRAERFEGYREKRATEAGMSADTFDAGPSAFGHQSQARAERQAARHDRNRTRAVSQWGKAEYWHSRIAGVIASALYKSSPAVRRSRILRLEAEQRKHEKTREEYAAKFAGWSKVATLEGADKPGVYVSTSTSIGFTPESVTPALRLAYNLANYSGYSLSNFTHPRTGKDGQSSYDLLTDREDPCTPAEVAALWLASATDPTDPDSNSARWSDHYANRLAYERAMLAEEGGTAGDAEMIPGGFIRGHQIHAVVKSPATGKVTSVRVMSEGKLKLVNVQRLPEGVYRAPTAEQLEAFHAAQKEAKATAKATKQPAPSLINPTDEDAQKLQDLWNAAAKARDARAPEVKVWRMTQAEYSARSKGDYGPCESSEVSEKCQIMSHGRGGRVCVFKVRTGSAGGFSFTAARAVVVLTDKPQKALPWETVADVRATMPTEAEMFTRLGDIAAAMNWTPGESAEHGQLLRDAQYLGWVNLPSISQREWTKAGADAYKRFAASEQPAELATV